MTAAERRHFHRATFNTEVQLTFNNSTQKSTILDCSIKGAKIERQVDWDLPIGASVELVWTLDLEQQEAIRMQTEVARISPTSLGLRCLHIDIDSISHLRRLLELNLGDTDLLERDLEHLLDEQ